MVGPINRYARQFLESLRKHKIKTNVIIDLPNVLLFNVTPDRMIQRIALLLSFLEELRKFGLRISLVYNTERGPLAKNKTLGKVVLSLLKYAKEDLDLHLYDAAEWGKHPDRLLLELVNVSMDAGYFPLIVSMDRRLNNHKDLLIAEDRERKKRKFKSLETITDIDYHRVIIPRSRPTEFSLGSKILSVLHKNVKPPMSWPKSIIPEEPIEVTPPDVFTKYRLVVIHNDRIINVGLFYYHLIRNYVELKNFIRYIGFPQQYMQRLRVFIRRPIPQIQCESRIKKVLEELKYEARQIDMQKLLKGYGISPKEVLSRRLLVYVPLLIATIEKNGTSRYFLINTRFGIRSIYKAPANYVREHGYEGIKSVPIILTKGIRILMPKKMLSFEEIFDKRVLSRWFAKNFGTPKYMIYPLILLEPYIYLPGIWIEDKILTLTIDACLHCAEKPRIYVDVEREFGDYYLYRCKQCQKYVLRSDTVRINNEIYCKECHRKQVLMESLHPQ